MTSIDSFRLKRISEENRMTELVSHLDTGHKEEMGNFVRNIFPSHEVWCVPFFRMGEVFFRKHPSRKEIINDMDNNIVNFYLMVRNRWEQLYFLIEGTLHCDFFSNLADDLLKDEKTDELYRAWAFWLKCNKAFVAPNKWSVNDLLPQNEMKQGEVQKKVLQILSERLTNVYISNRDPVTLIQEADSPQTLFFIQPQTKKEVKLIEGLLKEIKGKIVVHYNDTYGLKKLVSKYGLYTDDDCLTQGICTNFKRQLKLFE